MNPETGDIELKRRLLRGLLDELDRVRRRRTRARRAGASAASVLLAFAVVILSRAAFTPGPSSPRVVPTPPTTSVFAGGSAVEISTVHTDSSALARWRIGTDSRILAATALSQPTTIVERIGDEQLLGLLAAMGRPTGIARSGGRAWLTAEGADADPPGSG